MTKVLVLHAYSSKNKGDGLLVDESVDLIKEVFGKDVSLEIIASDPDSFAYLNVPVYNAKPGKRGWSRAYLSVLRNLDRYDILIGVGGGYLRGGHPIELLKCLLVMGPQIFAAGKSKRPSVYLPQSVGPFRLGSRYIFRPLMRKISTFMLRDDRSMQEVVLNNCRRFPDLALTSPRFTQSIKTPDDLAVDPTVVFTTRAIRGVLPPLVGGLGTLLRGAGIPVVGYVQSEIGGNNDTKVQQQLTDTLITQEQYLDAPARVVVAVRLHAALMAMKAGHFVIHLAYERKGFSAFADAGLSEWVHNVNDFSPAAVLAQVQELLGDEATRHRYRTQLHEHRAVLEQKYAEMVSTVRSYA